ncbi:MAG: transcription elongation factor GreA, partial [Parcubacteria group bacterium GW2011_GWE2_39_37]
LTEAKFNELKNKLERLKKYSHPRAVEEVKRLAEMGDFSDNAAYSMAKGRLRGINQRILDIEDHLKRSLIITPLKDSTTVQLGHHVTVEVSGRQKTYLLLGSAETDPSKGIISHNSPIGSALIGRRVGDIIIIKTLSKDVEYKIVRIE